MIRYLLLKITPRMSFPISKRLTFFGLFFVYAVFKVHKRAYIFILNLYVQVTFPIFRKVISVNPMGLSGLEPPTSRLSGVRSNRLSYKPICGSFLPSGDEEIRTLDPLLARQVLSQLSYIPMILAFTCSPTPSPVQYHRPFRS